MKSVVACPPMPDALEGYVINRLRSKTDSRQLRPQLLIGWSTYNLLAVKQEQGNHGK